MPYSKEFLENICDRLGVKDPQERERFAGNIDYAGDLYLFLKQINPKNSRIAKQKALLQQYYKTLSKAQGYYEKIQKDNVCEGRLSLALRGEYNTLPPETQERITPYMNAGGRYEPLFADALAFHLKASKTAANMPHAKKPEKDVLVQWLVFLRVNWPKKAKIKFALGDYLKERREYKSLSRDVLYDLIAKIDPSVTSTYVTSLMREVIEDDITQAPAFFTANPQ